jgi:hypothetical protein
VFSDKFNILKKKFDDVSHSTAHLSMEGEEATAYL